jgi:hypothetical protein
MKATRTEGIIRTLLAVPRILLPLVPIPFAVAAALSLWSVVNLVVHSAGGSIS